ncbi:hypothetical protein A3D78_01575 [Candidatus Gottesmanbacteria bacterium RIFCSPHIGHO2_02_FULL_39_14]|uniref:2,3-bisphosphoglycerate-dependent phosphoglycerate mutase n=3 Tax=Candidatus Gottesmaniibacteriota TaxID=1752720 RepID=A0A1F5ZY96_9BACT|nr:MAG: hypothetical protein A2153_05395 [Candidatus Gottesmanbacteria bacterium RBG_16_38_7b]OGG17333.1 MAG: hypothetical protein A3D78_01575 [Candidatus Gottesmanbacteria bacterium RIFCSPHIGHO2_02_FULL_39_14]OGG32440.1 MAG: hypothetical protein A3I51_05265 [Candidatus Gottesmanbacteria bacterium RIFCSPLOWO2_02_FULL_38_8]
MAKIVLIRHGESEWNKIGLWTGWKDISLSRKGHREAKAAAKVVKDIFFHLSFSSDLERSWRTLEIILTELKLENIPVIKHHALKERHYGEFTGKNKWQIKKKVGAEKFKNIRRGWDEPIKDGETLKDVYDRVIPYYQESILPHLRSGKNVLLVAHGNSIRALIKHLEGISDSRITEVELATGEVILYDIDKQGKVKSSQKRRE